VCVCVCVCVCVFSVCLLDTAESSTKTTQLIEVSFGVWWLNSSRPREPCIGWGPESPTHGKQHFRRSTWMGTPWLARDDVRNAAARSSRRSINSTLVSRWQQRRCLWFPVQSQSHVLPIGLPSPQVNSELVYLWPPFVCLLEDRITKIIGIFSQIWGIGKAMDKKKVN